MFKRCNHARPHATNKTSNRTTTNKTRQTFKCPIKVQTHAHTRTVRERERDKPHFPKRAQGGVTSRVLLQSPPLPLKIRQPRESQVCTLGRTTGGSLQAKQETTTPPPPEKDFASFFLFFLSSSPFHDAPARSLAVAAQLKLLLIFNPGIKFNPHTQTHTRTRYRRTKFRGLVHRSSMSSPALPLSGRSVGKSRRLNARWIKESETLNVNTDEQKTKTCFFFTLIIPLLLSCWETRC